MHRCISVKRFSLFTLLALATLIAGILGAGASTANAQTASNGKIGSAFQQASSEFGVPAPLLEALCYMEGRLSNHNGSPSMDNGFGCMHLIQNKRADTLDQAASLLGVPANQLKTDIATNIRGGAAVLRTEAMQLSSTHSLPVNLAGWYGTVAEYSHSDIRSTALMYADATYKILQSGFSAQDDADETITLAPQIVTPNTATANNISVAASTLPGGCSSTPTGDYPNAVNCILDPNTFDCTLATTVYPPCNYEERTDAGYPLNVEYVVIHDTEESLPDTLATFQNSDPNTAHGASTNYVVDTDGTVYQIVHDSDFTYNVGNYWYNQHSIGIEHVGFDATGFQWYNAAEYLGSAKLVAYLLKKYNLPLDRNDIVAHGTVPSPFSGSTNHVDPGPYWMWDYYLDLIHRQGVPFPHQPPLAHTLEIHTANHLSKGGVETPADFNFFYLYNGPSTASGLIPQQNDPTDITDETNSIEADIPYYYLAKAKDQAGTGDTMYEIWYGDVDNTHNPNYPVDDLYFADGKLAWVAVPRGTRVTEGSGTLVTLNTSGSSTSEVFGDPITDDTGLFWIGSVPNGAVFVSGGTVIEDGTTSNLWYEINFNHRQAWVPASEVTVVHPSAATA